MVRANKEDKEEDPDFEIQFYEKILNHRPDFLQALMALGDLYTKKGLYKEGLVIDQKLARLKPYNSLILYNLACSYSLLNKIPEGFAAIQKAIECGYHDFAYLEKDPDLENLRREAEVRQYLTEVKNKYLTKNK